MQILAIGDVVGSIGCKFLRKHLPSLKKIKHIDMVIANGENSADGNGITPTSARYLFDSGVDVITTGNHAFRRRECYDEFDQCDTLLRPANFPKSAPGKGVCIFDMGRVRVGVVNVMGVVYMEPLDCPFEAVDKVLPNLPKITLVDFHAEATGEKGALAHYLDGKVSAVFGTHTHVQTADEQILPGGTGFISDLGMVGPIHSILGVKPELIVQKMKHKLPVRFENGTGDCHLDAVLFTIDEKTGKTTAVERIRIS
jgi:hypothetical protein